MPLKSRRNALKSTGHLDASIESEQREAPVSKYDDPDAAIAAGEVSDTDDDDEDDEEEEEDNENEEDDEEEDNENDDDDNSTVNTGADEDNENDEQNKGISREPSNGFASFGKKLREFVPENKEYDSENDSEEDSYNVDDDDDSEEEEDFQKFQDYSLISSLEKQHPEIRAANYDEVIALSRIVRDSKGDIVDPLHTTVPFLTKYEKAKLIGARAEQINRGAPPFVNVEPHIIDGTLIASKEFDEKLIPFIVSRPLPSGANEYWRLQDLEVL